VHCVGSYYKKTLTLTLTQSTRSPFVTLLSRCARSVWQVSYVANLSYSFYNLFTLLFEVSYFFIVFIGG